MQHELHLLAYFYPRPPRGGRREPESRFCCCRKFLSTPSARRATFDGSWGYQTTGYFYPRPPRGGRLASNAVLPTPCPISIHALREEGDCSVQHELHLLAYFYPRPPRGGRREPESRFCCCRKFLSTPSARRATFDGSWGYQTTGYFYPRPPRGGRLASNAVLPTPCPISIHALREEGDGSGTVTASSGSTFLSTPSARRATPSS